MSLTSGTRLGAYQITGLIGVGGMGEVYRASDTKLGRDVAIKTLPSELAKDPDRLARFEREAKLLAALNHLHIASVYSLDEHDGTLYLAMELVEGETLERKLASGRPPIDEALRLGLQIAEALEAAHEKGVVHRDLKPANIMVSGEGQVKVLDFGLAKAFATDPKQTVVGHSPALSLAMTQQGLVLGTAGYMSPEQASGQSTDQRADIWAFGVVLYELLTGKPLFAGESVPHILADVLKTEPDWSRLPRDLHPRLRLLLERCLEKKVRNRYHSIADVRVDIERVLADPRGVDAAFHAPVGARPATITKWTLFSLAALVILTASAFAIFRPRTPAEGGDAARLTFELSPPNGLAFSSWEWRVPFDVSSDSRWLAFVASKSNGPRSLWVRDMATGRVQQIAGTDGAYSPFWSGDNRSVAFWLGSVLYRVKVPGGAPQRITRTNGAGGGSKGSWSVDGKILLNVTNDVYVVSAEGGAAELVSRGGGRDPTWLSDGAHYLTVRPSGIFLASIKGDEPTGLVLEKEPKRIGIAYVPGYLFYAIDNILWVDKFDETKLKLAGSPRRLASDIPSAPLGQASFSASAGVLAYWTGALIQPSSQLLWVDRSGNELSPVGSPTVYDGFDVSPDGTHVVASHVSQGQTSIWVHDLNVGNAFPLAFNDHRDTSPIYSFDGRKITYLASPGLNSADADGFGTPVRLVSDPPGNTLAGNWNSLNQDLIYEQWTAGNGVDLFVYHAEDNRSVPVPWNTSANETAGRFSPDGRWVAYVTDQSERNEVWVAAFPSGQPQQQISIAGGTHPAWSGDGSELFFISADGQLTVVPFSSSDGRIVLGEHKKLFAVPGPIDVVAGSHNMYKPSADGQRFLIARKRSEDIPPISVIVNWRQQSEGD